MGGGRSGRRFACHGLLASVVCQEPPELRLNLGGQRPLPLPLGHASQGIGVLHVGALGPGGIVRDLRLLSLVVPDQEVLEHFVLGGFKGPGIVDGDAVQRPPDGARLCV